MTGAMEYGKRDLLLSIPKDMLHNCKVVKSYKW